MNLLLNIIWLICGGFLICVEYIVSSLLLMITIVGIPFGFQTLKLSSLVTLDKMQRPTCVCHRLIPVLIFREEEQKDKREKIRSFVLE